MHAEIAGMGYLRGRPFSGMSTQNIKQSHPSTFIPSRHSPTHAAEKALLHQTKVITLWQQNTRFNAVNTKSRFEHYYKSFAYYIRTNQPFP